MSGPEVAHERVTYDDWGVMCPDGENVRPMINAIAADREAQRPSPHGLWCAGHHTVVSRTRTITTVTVTDTTEWS